MSWVRIDDQAPLNPKLLRAGPSACWLWVCGLAYAQSHHTDGFIPVEALPMIGVKGVALSRTLAAQLVRAGLFESVDGGFRIHDYLVHNESGAEAKARRDEITEARRKAGRAGGLLSAQRRQEEAKQIKQTDSNGQANQLKQNPSTLQAPSHPIPSEEKKQPSAVGRQKAPPDPRVKVFLDWFQSEYETRRSGAKYLVTWEKHGALVKHMLGAVDLETLKIYAQIMLSEKCDDAFIIDSDRGIEVLKGKFNWLSERYAAWKKRQPV